MSVLSDYRCARCGGVSEALVLSPPPPSRACPACGGEARRLFAAVGLVRGDGAARGGGVAAADTAKPRTPLCLRFRDVPGLCHMTPSAARRWVALARGDGRALDRELERQENAAAAGSPGPVVDTHHHRGEERTGEHRDRGA